MTTKKQPRAGAAPAPAAPSALAGINDRALLDIIECQRDRLHRVRDVLDCVRAAVEANPSAVEGAIGLAVAAILDTIDALDETALLRTARAETAWIEKTVAGSDAAVRAAAEAAREAQS